MKSIPRILNKALIILPVFLIASFMLGSTASGNACPPSATTTLNQTGVTSSSPTTSGTLTVTSTASFPASGAYVIQIDNEEILVSTTTGTTMSIQDVRGYNSTTAAAHSNGATISLVSCNASTTINSTISKVISAASTTGTVDLSVFPSGAGAQTIASDTVTVSTNDIGGYALTIAMDPSKASSSLVSGSNSIPSSSGSQASPVTQAVNTWGYCVTGIGGFSTNCPSTSTSSAAISGTYKFAGLPLYNSPNTIKTTSSTATNDTTTVWYAVAANTSQPTGTYSSTVTYTAIAN